MTKQIWFIRHGQSVTNAGGAWDDPSTIPLTDKGHVQAKLVAEALSEKPSLIITSPYIRTLETARPTLERWSDVQHIVWPVHEFTYLSSKRLGITTMTMRQQDVKNYWDSQDPDYVDGEDAESYREFMQRVDDAIERIMSLDYEKTFIFSHGQFLKALFYRLDRIEKDDLISMSDLRSFSEEFSVKNTAIAHYSFFEDGSSNMHSISIDHLGDKVSE